jgi:hypothetical protein
VASARRRHGSRPGSSAAAGRSSASSRRAGADGSTPECGAYRSSWRSWGLSGARGKLRRVPRTVSGLEHVCHADGSATVAFPRGLFVFGVLGVCSSESSRSACLPTETEE